MTAPRIHSLAVGDLAVLCYLVACPGSGRAVLIDPAGQPGPIVDLVRRQGAGVEYILCTHGHQDHTLGNQALKQALAAPVALHQADDEFFASPQGEAAARELGLAPAGRADLRLRHGQVLAVGSLEVEVIHTPGHSPGSVCFRVGDNLFTGDTLFVGAVGRTDLPGASLQTLLDSLARRILPLPDNTVIWPGHDYGETPFSTLGREKRENPYITDFILEA